VRVPDTPDLSALQPNGERANNGFGVSRALPVKPSYCITLSFHVLSNLQEHRGIDFFSFKNIFQGHRLALTMFSG
jgi:hypothetical protein